MEVADGGPSRLSPVRSVIGTTGRAPTLQALRQSVQQLQHTTGCPCKPTRVQEAGISPGLSESRQNRRQLVIIDIHNHIVAGEGTQPLPSPASSTAGASTASASPPSPRKASGTATWNGHKHTEVLDQVGTDMAFISPRPYTMMHSEKPEKIVRWYCEAVNDAIALQVKVEPTRFRGIAGLPQNAGVGPGEHLRGDRPLHQRAGHGGHHDQPGSRGRGRAHPGHGRRVLVSPL